MPTVEVESAKRSFSYARILRILVPVFILAIGFAAYIFRQKENVEKEFERDTLWRLLGEQNSIQKLSTEFIDSDSNWVADPPTKADLFLSPKTIRFSYVAQSDDAHAEATWKEFLNYVGQKTGCETELVSFNSPKEQLQAIKSGDLHLTAFATGEVESAVNSAGFVPLACLANKSGQYGYKMQLIVTKDSTIQKVEDIKGKRLIFTRPKSNSGCVAPLVLLANEFNLHLDKDYEWGMSQSHENSIRGIANGSYEVAVVASDILENMVARDNEITRDKFRIIYESKPYPSAAFGVPHNLDKRIVESLREVFFMFEWQGTGLEKTFGADGSVQFAMVNYKDDWESVRKIRETANSMSDRVNPEHTSDRNSTP